MAPTTTAAPEVTAVLSVLAEPMRWQILSLLVEAELCTTHLQELLGVGQPLVSHHLRALREAGLVSTEPCGRYTYYRLVPGALDEACAALSALAQAASLPVCRRPC